MNNRFNFRGYRKSDQKMYEVYNLHIGTGNVIITERYGNNAILLGDYILMQCTGLKDRNGTLIYEGDIVEVLPEEEYAVIEWNDDTARFDIRMISEKVCADFDNYYGDELEVIGNICENPELLKGENNEQQI